MPRTFGRRPLLVAGLLFAGAVAGLACKGTGNLKTLTVDQVAARLAANDGKTIPYDCNAKERYAKGHLPGARWVEYDAVTAADLPQDKGTMLVFYCASELLHACHTAAVAAEKLGYTNVYIMPAGIAGWVAAGKAEVT